MQLSKGFVNYERFSHSSIMDHNKFYQSIIDVNKLSSLYSFVAVETFFHLIAHNYMLYLNCTRCVVTVISYIYYTVDRNCAGHYTILYKPFLIGQNTVLYCTFTV